jgi:gliding motility-associated lipoprotein GldD
MLNRSTTGESKKLRLFSIKIPTCPFKRKVTFAATMNRFIPYTFLFICLGILFSGCNEKYTPKPRGYFRINFPEKKYKTFINSFPYSFEYPVYASVVPDTMDKAEPFWIDIDIPGNKAKFHLSYKKVKDNLSKLTEDSREMAYKHAIKATSIVEKNYINPANKVFGTVYYIKGNAASPMQFYLTDSTNNFLRGSFYISEIPNYDSLLPVITFLETDLTHLIETLHWN